MVKVCYASGTFFGEPGEHYPDGGHVLLNRGRRSLALQRFDVGGDRYGLNVFEVLITGTFTAFGAESVFMVVEQLRMGTRWPSVIVLPPSPNDLLRFDDYQRGERKCAKALLSKVALVGVAGWSSHQGQFKVMRNGSISSIHFQLQCHGPQCFLHQSFHILRRCRKGP